LLNIQRYVVLLNCKVMKISFIYLGVSIGGIMLELFFGRGWYKRLRKDYQCENISIYLWRRD